MSSFMTNKDERPAPDAGNTEDIETLTAPLDEDDDVHERLALVNTEGPDIVEQAPDDDPLNRP